MGVTVLKKNAGDDDGRAGLRAAIRAAAVAQTAVEERRNAIERARHFVGEVQGRIEAATIALNNASEEHAGKVAAAIAQGEKPPAATGVKAARAKLNDHQDELVSAQAALERIGDDLGDLEHGAAEAANTVLIEVGRVIVPTGAQLFQRAKELKAELLILMQAVFALVGEAETGVPLFGGEVARLTAADARRAPIAELKDQFFRFSLTATDEDWARAKEAAEPWRRAKFALRSNADVELPPS
jgi:hypothetical protein